MKDGIALVTGAGGGIGAELCRQLLETGNTVVACPRRSGSETLTMLAGAAGGRLLEVTMDVADADSVAEAARRVERHVDRIDLLVNNAGVYPRDTGLAGLQPEELIDGFKVNAVGPLLVARALLPLLRRGKGKRLVQLTSRMGSIEDNTSGGSYAYRMSKAALNMAVRNLAHELGPEGFVVLAVHPGWVQTRMGGAGAPLALEAASAEVLRIALESGQEANGGFIGPGGERLPF